MKLTDRLNKFNEARNRDQEALISALEEQDDSNRAHIQTNLEDMQALIDHETNPIVKAALAELFADNTELMRGLGYKPPEK